jgi:hypothetical protein
MLGRRLGLSGFLLAFLPLSHLGLPEMNDHTAINFRQLALELAGKGLPVFPCNPANKRPYTNHGFEDASTDPVKVTAFWAKHPRALIGIPTGRTSGVFALDLDTDDGTGEALGEAWLDSVGLADLLEGPGAETPSGGRHLYFRADGLAEGLRNTTCKPLGVDTHRLQACPAERAVQAQLPGITRSVHDCI